MNKTALTELIEVIDPLFEKIPLSDRQHTINTLLNIIKNKAILLLPKEREDMEACIGLGVFMFPKDISNAFDSNFTQYKTNSNG